MAKKPTIAERLAEAEARLARVELHARLFRAYVRARKEYPPKSTWFPMTGVFQNYVVHTDELGMVDQAIPVNSRNDTSFQIQFLRGIVYDKSYSEETRESAEREACQLSSATDSALLAYSVAR